MTSKTYIGIGRNTDGSYLWWLTTASGERIYNSTHFATKQACERAIKQMKRVLLSAPVMDVSARLASETPQRMRLVA